MQFSTLLVASAAFALAQSKVFLANMDFASITAGEDFTINWGNATGAVSLILLGRQPDGTVTDPANLFPVYTIESNLNGVSSYTWSVPANTPKSTYAIEIRDAGSGLNNYSQLWEVIDGVPATTLLTGTPTGSRTASRTATGSNTASATESAETESATESSTVTRSATTSASRTGTSTSASTTATAAPAGGMASGLTSNLALVFGAAAALFMLN